MGKEQAATVSCVYANNTTATTTTNAATLCHPHTCRTQCEYENQGKDMDGCVVGAFAAFGPACWPLGFLSAV